MAKVYFRDCFKIIQPSEEQKAIWNDSFNYEKPEKGLFVHMDATHSAIGNRNNRFYLPSMMSKGVGSFFRMHGKSAPILKHHGGGMFGGDQDPVGKVRSAEYVETIPENLSDSDDVMAITDSTVPLRKQIRAAKRFLRNDFVHEDEWQGLGFVRLGAEILDPKAIQQVRDGLFDSVSVSFGTNHAYCSVCGADWADDSDGPCEHKPGKTYTDEDTDIKERMFLIPGAMSFTECSLVNRDADPHTVISIASGNMSDSDNDTLTFFDEHVYDIRNMTWEIQDSEGRANMKKIDVKDGAPIELNDAEEAVFNLLKDTFDDVDEVTAEKAKKLVRFRQEDGTFIHQADAELDNETYFRYALEDLETEGQEINADEVYADMVVELEKMMKDGELTEEELKDAKLSTEQRKKLSGKTFCGPNRSFPVPDCPHVTAARRLIGRYKGPGNKSSILSCVSRKAKALGCGSSSDADPTPPPVADNDQDPKTLKDMSNEEIHTMFHDVEKEMIDRKLTVQRECSDCACNLKKAEDANAEVETIKKDLEDAQVTLSILRDELRSEFSNYKQVVDDSVELRSELREARTKIAAMTAVLGEKEKSLADAETSLNEAKDFEKQIITYTDGVNLEEIFAKINDGMVNNDPEGSVDNPVKDGAADNLQQPEDLSKPEKAILDRCKEHLSDGDEHQAKMLFLKMKHRGILRDSLTWETISTADKDADE